MRNIVICEYGDIYKDGVIDLILEIQQKEFGLAITKEDQPDLGDIRNFYQVGNGNFWVAICDEKVVGTISLKDIENKQGALRKMFVDAEFRGKATKTAQRLLENLLAWARAHKMTEIYLGTTEKFLAAHRFYERNKFSNVSTESLPSNFPVMSVDTRFYKYTL